MQPIRPRPGQRCWVKEVAGYELPKGLPDREPVTILRVPESPAWRGNCLARDAGGREWQVYILNVDAGSSVWLDGRRVYEPELPFMVWEAHHLQQLYTERRQRCLSGGDVAYMDRIISHCRWVLERNGWDPDAPPPPGPVPQLEAGRPDERPDTTPMRGPDPRRRLRQSYGLE